MAALYTEYLGTSDDATYAYTSGEPSFYWDSTAPQNFAGFYIPSVDLAWSYTDLSEASMHSFEGSFPLITFKDIVTPFQLQTLEHLTRAYSLTTSTPGLCLGISLDYLGPTPTSGIPPTADYITYDIKTIMNDNPIPTVLPFLKDSLSTVIPEETLGKQVQGAMLDAISAIRSSTSLIPDPHNPSNFRFQPPNTQEVQNMMQFLWPEKYKPAAGEAKEWRNTVNQCLTHGQGWNFISYEDTDGGGKLKRHILFERAYNGLCILGPGQCKALNDKRKASKSLRAAL